MTNEQLKHAIKNKLQPFWTLVDAMLISDADFEKFDPNEHAALLQHLAETAAGSRDGVIELLNEIKEAPQWTSIEDSTPLDEVLAVNECQEMLLGYMHKTDKICENESEALYDVTHWMPLPESPKS